MFPFDIEELKNVKIENDDPWEYKVDFETGEIKNQVITGLDAIKTWAWMALKVDRYKYPVYSWDYGQEIDNLIGKSYKQEYLQIELEQMITDCLMANANITGIEDLECSIENDVLAASFTILTDYGEVKMDV